MNGAELHLQMYEVPGIEFRELEEGLCGTFKYAFRDDKFKLFGHGIGSGIFMSFYIKCFSQTSFATVILAVLKRGEILGESRVQQGLKHGHLHLIIFCCSSVF